MSDSVVRHPKKVGGEILRACSRNTLTRVIWIHGRLAGGDPVTAISIARELEVSDRTIKRDIEWMRDQLGADIIWQAASHSYVYRTPCDLLPLLRLDAEEALALTLAGKTFAAWGGSPLGRALTGALGKIAGVIGSAVSLPADSIGELLFRPDDFADTDAEQHNFAILLEAIRRRRQVRIAYRKPGATAADSRIVHPLHLAWLDHRWMLLAQDANRRALRSFLLARIESLEPTGETFAPPAGFDPRTVLAGNFGLFTGDRLHDVRIRFDSVAAPFIRERRWHPSQEIRELAGGAIEAAYQVNHLTDIRRWILSWGSHAEALAPAELRRAVHHEVAATAARYSAKSGKSYSQGRRMSRRL